jgi:hypothetical protein
LGPGLDVRDEDAPEIASVWTHAHVEVAYAVPVGDRRMRALWRRRRGDRPTPLLLLCPADGGSLLALGPQRGDGPIHRISIDALVAAMKEIELKSFGLRPEAPQPEPPRPLTEDDLGVVCFQVVLSGSGEAT